MKKLTKLTAFLLVFALGIAGISSSASAKSSDNITTELQQLGAADLVITNAREFNDFANIVNNGNNYSGKLVVLANDIAFDGVTVNNFTPIQGFAGTFDGQGYSISGIMVVCTGIRAEDCAALFATVSSRGVIQNVTVKNSQFQAVCGAAGIVAGNSGTVRNCAVMATEIESTDDDAGGIVASNGGDVVNCYSANSNTISAYRCAGGIVANNSGNISNCVNLSPVSNSHQFEKIHEGVGGIAGYVTGGTIQNCYNAGVVQADATYAGGIAGNVSNRKGIVSNCYTLDAATPLCFGIMNGTLVSYKPYTAAYMQSDAFVNELNANRGSKTEWLSWEKRSESVYPLLSKPKQITTCNISIANCVYNGEAQTPAVVITDGANILTQETDYTVTYSNNINAGTGTAIITGNGAYMGTASIDFIIEKAEQSFQYTKSYNKVYGDSSFYVNVTRSVGDGRLTYQTSNAKIADVNTSGVVSIKNIGKATITVTAAETDNYKAAAIKLSIVVKPQKMSITSAVVKSGRLRISWRKDSKAQGYQLQYSTDKKFKKGVTTVNIKKKKTVSYKSKKIKKGKTYYVRARAYKGNLYGAWSKKVKVKK